LLYNVIQQLLQETDMLAVRLEKQLETAIERIAEVDGSTKSGVIREAVVRYLEDREDIALAEQAKKMGGRAKTIAEMRKALGLDG
jgi:RHH-type rel operon transcriptional repressor/antitoxin RelB